MMVMLKVIQKVKYKKVPVQHRFLTLATILALAAGFVLSPLALADQYDEQIKQIQAENSQKKANVNQLQIQADSYQGENDRLQGQINAIQQQIRENEAKR